MIATERKHCPRCNKTMPLGDFYRLRKAADGHQGYCKGCHKGAVKEWQHANPVRRAENKKLSRQRNPETKLEATRRERDRHPEKYRARTALGHAVERGQIIKPECCQDCGNEIDSRLLHGHHKDYSKPLEVEWLCHGCHESVHRGLKRSFAGRRGK